MMNGHLYAEYNQLAGMLGLPHCSNQQWPRIVGKLEEKVTELAEWSCCKVREMIKQKHTLKYLCKVLYTSLSNVNTMIYNR